MIVFPRSRIVMKVIALFIVFALAVIASAQTNNGYTNLQTVTLSYEQPSNKLEDRLFSRWRLDDPASDLVWLKPNQQWAFGHYDYRSQFSLDRFRYRPNLSFGIDDGLFGATVIHRSNWTGRTEPRYISFNLFGIIPFGRVRVNGG